MKQIVALMLALVAAGCSNPPESASSPSSPAAPATVTATSVPSTPRAGLEDLPTGPAPRVGFVVGTTYVDPDGTRIDLAQRHQGRIGGVTAFRGGLVVDDGLYFEGTSGLSVLTAEGTEPLSDACTSGAPVTDGDTVAWASFACPESGQVAPTVLHVRSAVGERTQRLSDPPDQNVLTGVVGLLDGDVIFSRAFGTGGVFRSDLVGRPRRIPATTGVDAVDERGGLLVARSDTDGHRIAVLDTRDGVVLWRDRRWYAADFSPDGTRLVGYGRSGAWTIRDARSGALLLALGGPGDLRLTEVGWEDDRHLVALARALGESALVRIGPAGVMERITPVRCASCDAGYLLAG